MANTTTIYYANPNGKRALQIQHANTNGTIEKTLKDAGVELIGYCGKKINGHFLHDYNTTNPIGTEVQDQLKRLKGVETVCSL